jgi:hypothetical protein
MLVPSDFAAQAYLSFVSTALVLHKPSQSAEVVTIGDSREHTDLFEKYMKTVQQKTHPIGDSY